MMAKRIVSHTQLTRTVTGQLETICQLHHQFPKKFKRRWTTLEVSHRPLRLHNRKTMEEEDSKDPIYK